MKIKAVWDKLIYLFFKTEKGLYLVFGALTTLVSLIAFWVCFNAFSLNTELSTLIKNIAGIIFAYFTNRSLVFKSEAKAKAKLQEFMLFSLARVATLLLDIYAIMPLFVNTFSIDANIATVISTVIVIILNYVASKLFVFRKEEKNQEEE